MNLLLQEKIEFIKGMKLQPNLSLTRKEDYYFGMEKAFDDAFKQYARREKKKYATAKQTLMEPIVDRLFKYFNSAEDNFNSCFNDCIALSKQILNNNRYGVAQKFTNMSFKYLYCYADAINFENKFYDCHMPLDKYTIKWVKSLKNKTLNQQLGAVNNAWANIDEELYNNIQGFIGETLKSNIQYTISYNKKHTETTCILPENRLYAEFIIWHQEKVNELYAIIKRAENDFERIGIDWC